MKLTVKILLAFALLTILAACGPAEVPPVVEIRPNETAFVIPLEGNTKSGQDKFMSLEYLNQNKLAAKRITIPVRKRSMGRAPWNYEWLPTFTVIKVDRTPVTCDWTDDITKGTSNTRQGFSVESKDSIGFTIGATITTSVSEENSALFLYRYAGKNLFDITNTNIRGFIQGKLTGEFGTRNLKECKLEKGEIFAIAYAAAKKEFEQYGVTINFFGPNEGLVYDNVAIQDSIDKAYAAEMLILQRTNEKTAQDEDNKRIKAAADTKLYEAQKFAAAEAAQSKMIKLEIERINAEAKLTMAKKWSGNLPEKILPANSNLLMGID